MKDEIPKWYEVTKWKEFREENKLNTNAFNIYMTAFIDRVSVLLLCSLALGIIIGSHL